MRALLVDGGAAMMKVSWVDDSMVFAFTLFPQLKNANLGMIKSPMSALINKHSIHLKT